VAVDVLLPGLWLVASIYLATAFPNDLRPVLWTEFGPYFQVIDLAHHFVNPRRTPCPPNVQKNPG
jgi:hypothetical protein